MAGYAKILLVGNVGTVDDLKYLQSGKAVLNWSLAVNIGKGEQQETYWYRCALFGERAEALSKYIVKGKQLYVEGSLKPRKYDGKNGSETSLDVDVREIVLLGGGEQGAPKADGLPVPDGQDIPF